MVSPDEITLRPLETQHDFRQCVALQYEIWGRDFDECVPPSLLLAVQKVGGVAAGAFDPEGGLLGFVFGISGVRGGRTAHWSDMLAVRADARGLGLGRRLKAYQRLRLLEQGIEVAYWSYDPLEARNAHLNIVRLGARPIEYVPDMYGTETGSALHEGIGTDRFVIEWQLDDPRVEAVLAGRDAGEGDSQTAPDEAPLVNSEPEPPDGLPRPAEPSLVEAPRVRVEVPADIQALKREAPDLAGAWRRCTRRACLHYMERGYRVTGFQRRRDTGRCFYLLERLTGKRDRA